MNLDRTFCQGARCNRTETCDRFIGVLREWFKQNPHRHERLVSVAEFADHKGDCKMYSRISPENVMNHGEVTPENVKE